jgi:hypothetical protein
MDDLTVQELAEQVLICKNTACCIVSPAETLILLCFICFQTDRPVVKIAQDEMIAHAGDRQCKGWTFACIQSYQTPEKSAGDGVMVSAFIDGDKVLQVNKLQLASINRKRASLSPPSCPIQSNSSDGGAICSFQLHIGKNNEGVSNSPTV